MPSLRVLGFVFIACVEATVQAQDSAEFGAVFIVEELQRAKTDPDNRIEFRTSQSPERTFNALLSELPFYSDQVSSLVFDHRDSNSDDEIGIGSRRITRMENEEVLVQKIIEFDMPNSFAYFTDMSESTIRAPLDFSIGYYRFRKASEGGTVVEVSTAYRPSSRLTAFLVRLGFDRAFRNDFRKAEQYLESLTD